MASPYADTRYEVAVGSHMLVDFGLAIGVRASLGHVSVRVPGEPDKFVVKGRGYRLDTLARMRAEDTVVCNLEGEVVDSPPNIVPCFEVKIHSCIFKARPDVMAVVHVHPKFATVMSVIGKPIRSMVNEGNRLVMDPIPVYPKQKIITTDEEGTEVARLLGQGKVELLRGHGAVTAGKNMEEAVTDMIHLEHHAEMNYYACVMAGMDHDYVSREQVLEFSNSSGSQYDLPHFKQAIAKAGMPQYGGVWQAWFEDAAAKV
ncbi:MAG: class II aldolase/adducin family protein [Dehalococcoidia bacterium]|nr:class II aldolase/adducin family protein [Dehalococcoidia bacterium]